MTRPTRTIERICERCHTTFSTYQSRLNYGHSKFCSIACYRDVRVSVTCQQCGVPFSTTSKRGARFCSRECVGRQRTAAADAAFWSKVDKLGPSECWNWTGGISSYGYGKVKSHGRTLGTHRVAYELLVGQIPPDLTIDHLCLNKKCANPAHMELVTREENSRRARVTYCSTKKSMSLVAA